MIVKYIAEADMASKGINFITGYEYEVSDEVAKYLKEFFPTKFEFKEVVKEKVATKKVEVDIVVTPK